MEQPKNNLKVVSSKKNARVILPNMLTLIGVCIGLTSIRFALDEKFGLAIIAIIFAALIDGLDGRIARLIKGTSKVGKELDSLTDMISFGVAPAFIMYFWKLNGLGRFGWLVCLIYVICVLDVVNINYNIVVPTFFILTSLLLISKFPTYSFKKIVIRRNTTIFLLFGIVLFFGMLLIYTFEVLAISSLIYLLLIPVGYLHFQKIKKDKNENGDTDEDNDKLEDIL